eukprot:14157514-Heterocapsa_arctica.AAC.1
MLAQVVARTWSMAGSRIISTFRVTRAASRSRYLNCRRRRGTEQSSRLVAFMKRVMTSVNRGWSITKR